MLFHTQQFVIFFVILLCVLGVIRAKTQRKLVLLVASYIFYAWWNPAFLLLLMSATAIDYTLGRLMTRELRPHRRRIYLVTSLTANLSILAIFKYAGFLSGALLWIPQHLGFGVNLDSWKVTLPVGISFYTFHTMSYGIDTYRGKIKATKSVTDYALSVAFFPQLVAGPIVRASEFLPQLEAPIRLHFDRAIFFLILRGLIKKVVISDGVATLANQVFEDPAKWPSIIIWLATVAFAIQIYCDFSGYTDMATGIAAILGFRLPENFNRPYFAANPSEFWQRWHITLSRWLRDYVYIPLGGNREGRWRTYRNLMLTMLLGGLWHGASWNFVLWGALHGVALVVHRAWTELRPDRSPATGVRRVLSIAAMQYWVLLTWITFRVRDSHDMVIALRKFIIFDFNFSVASIGLGTVAVSTTTALIAAFLFLHIWSQWRGGLDVRLARARWGVAVVAAYIAGAVLLFLWPMAEEPFIYFQF